MNWTIAEARRRFSELVNSTQQAPQAILNRTKPVAVLVDMATFAKFQQWQASSAPATVWEASSELREICADDGSILLVPGRMDRTNAFSTVTDDLSR